MTAADTPSREEMLLKLAKEIADEADNISATRRTHPAGAMVKWAARLQTIAAAKPADHGARLSASEVACYKYPDGDQQQLRAAFIEGAVYFSQSPNTGERK